MKRLLLLIAPLLTQCATQNPHTKEIDRVPFHRAAETSSLEGVTIPVLHSAKLEKRWGKPKITVLPDGSYHLSYSKSGNGFETLSIYGVPGSINSDAPTAPTYQDIGYDEKRKTATMVPYQQKWQTIEILGRPIHLYIDNPGGGADAFQLSTVTFSHQIPGKPIGSYRIVSSSNIDGPGEVIDSYIKTVTF
ncbi:MAG TPA: hypothetical protein VM511_10095 [Luteolibacter sp.]|nr:hypothetical protein [Luteolibacter sp.]